MDEQSSSVPGGIAGRTTDDGGSQDTTRRDRPDDPAHVDLQQEE